MGLGDLVEIITKYTGIKWLVKKIWGEDCGCDERKEQWNKIKINRNGTKNVRKRGQN